MEVVIARWWYIWLSDRVMEIQITYFSLLTTGYFDPKEWGLFNHSLKPMLIGICKIWGFGYLSNSIGTKQNVPCQRAGGGLDTYQIA